MKCTHIPFQKTGFFSKIITDYLDQKESIQPFYHNFPNLEGFASQIHEKEKEFPLSTRKELVTILRDQYRNIDISDSTLENINLLESKNIFPSLPIKKDVLFIPIILDKNNDEILIFSESYLFNNWNLNTKRYHLLNFILPSEDLEDFNSIKNNSRNIDNYDFNQIVKKYNR